MPATNRPRRQAGATLTNAKVLYGVVPEVAAGLAKPWTQWWCPKGQAAAVKTENHTEPWPGRAGGQGRGDRQAVASANGKVLGEAPVVALADVERAGFFLRIKQRVAGWFSK